MIIYGLKVTMNGVTITGIGSMVIGLKKNVAMIGFLVTGISGAGTGSGLKATGEKDNPVSFSFVLPG
jgi:hypothetical protein